MHHVPIVSNFLVKCQLMGVGHVQMRINFLLLIRRNGSLLKWKCACSDIFRGDGGLAIKERLVEKETNSWVGKDNESKCKDLAKEKLRH